MDKIYNWLNDSKFIKPLSPGCELCSKGSKMVLFVTGLCHFDCFYCPLSFEKGGTDRIFADEWELKNENDTDIIIQEAKLIKAEGAGITGGDPLIVMDRTKKYISLLKDEFGSKFHVHLYTKAIKNHQFIDDLIIAGLDEIRFHPSIKYWNNMDNNPISKYIIQTINKDIDVAIEIPAIPNMIDEIISLIKWCNDKSVNWININELEFSERNSENFSFRNFIAKNDLSSSIYGSQITALKVLSKITEKDYDIGVHYCSCSFKDNIQLKNRIKRRAKSIVKNYEVISEEGTIIKGVIYPQKTYSLKIIYKKLIDEFRINKKKIFINKEKNRIELRILDLNKIATNLSNQGLNSYLIEEYPTADEIEVERIPLPI